MNIRSDHVKRYELAAQYVEGRTLDAACGCGYGTSILFKESPKVVGVDASKEALEWAERHFPGPGYIHGRIEDRPWIGAFDSIVSLETLEHLRNPDAALRLFRDACFGKFIASVPNEDHYPFIKENFAADDYPHFIHYRPHEFAGLLKRNGFEVKSWFCQKDKAGDIQTGTEGMFLIAVCE